MSMQGMHEDREGLDTDAEAEAMDVDGFEGFEEFAQQQRVRPPRPAGQAVYLGQEEFDALVTDVLDGLPREWSPLLDNMAVVVDEEPSEDDLRTVPQGSTLLGLYRGGAIRTQFLGGGLAGPAMSTPPEIALFQGPLERASADPDDLRERVRHTLVHEIGHHFGYSEDLLDNEEK